MDIADFILQLEADLKSEANVTDKENNEEKATEEKLNSNSKYRATTNSKSKKDTLKSRNGSRKSEDNLVDLEDDEEVTNDTESENVSSEEDDVPMEIDLSKSDSWTDTKDAFNRLRAGESLEGHEEIEAYWNRLSRGEKMTFYALVSAMAQVLTGGLGGKVAKLPSELGIKINKDTTDQEKKRSASIRRNAQNQGNDGEGAQTSASNDPNPIVVGESQDISSIKSYLKLING